jgi:hypothetical protein
MLGLEVLLARDSTIGLLTDSIAALPPLAWLSAFRIARWVDPARAERIINAVVPRATPGFPDQLVTGARLQLALARGHFELVDSLGAPGVQFNPGLLWTARKLIIASAIAGVAPTATDTGTASAARQVAFIARAIPVDSAVRWFGKHDVWNAGWLMAAWQAMYGDTVVTRRWQARIDSLPAGGHPVEWRAALRADLDARIAARRGDMAAALASASRALALWSVHPPNGLDIEPEPQIRLLTARLLRAVGARDSAAVLLRSLTPPATWLTFVTPTAQVELAEIAIDAGDCANATRRLDAALRLWSDSATAMRAVRTRAAADLKRCGGEVRRPGAAGA